MGLARKVLSGVGFITLAGAAAKAISIFTLPILSKGLGVEPYAKMALYNTIVGFGSTLALSGIDMSYNRHSVQIHKEKNYDIEVFCWRFAIINSIAFGAIGSIVWMYWSKTSVKTQSYAAMVFVGVVLQTTLTMANTRLRNAGSYHRIAVAIIANGAISSAISISLLQLGIRSATVLIYGILTGTGVAIVVLKAPVLKIVTSVDKLTFSSKKELIKLGASSSITAPMYWVITSADRWILASNANENVVGVYSVATSIASLGLIVNSSLTTAWFPEVGRVYSSGDELALNKMGTLCERLIIMLALIWLALSSIGGDIIRILTPASFHAGAEWIPVLAAAVFAYGVAGLGNTAFYLKQEMGWVARAWVIGAIANVTLNLILVPKYSASGAAISQLLSFSIIAFLNIRKSTEILRMPIRWHMLLVSAVPLCGTVLLMSKPWASSPPLSLLLKLPMVLFLCLAVMNMVASDWLKTAYVVMSAPKSSLKKILTKR